jgi:hypothetical protein
MTFSYRLRFISVFIALSRRVTHSCPGSHDDGHDFGRPCRHLSFNLFVAFPGISADMAVSGREAHLPLPVIVVIGVLFQQFLFFLVISLQAGRIVFSATALHVVFFQFLWAVISAPIIFLLLQMFFAYTDRVFAGKQNENGQSN